MLGEVVSEISGKVTGIRVLPSDGPTPKLEASVQGSGRLLGVEATAMATYLQTVRAGGVFYGEGHVVLVTQDGDIATWRGFGVGRPTGRGLASSFSGGGSIETASPKLARLNSVSTAFEYDVQENGDTAWKVWEWKSKADSG